MTSTRPTRARTPRLGALPAGLLALTLILAALTVLVLA